MDIDSLGTLVEGQENRGSLVHESWTLVSIVEELESKGPWSRIRRTGGPISGQREVHGPRQENGWARVQDQGEREAHGPRSGEREAHGPRSGERRPMIQDQEKGRSMI